MAQQKITLWWLYPLFLALFSGLCYLAKFFIPFDQSSLFDFAVFYIVGPVVFLITGLLQSKRMAALYFFLLLGVFLVAYLMYPDEPNLAEFFRMMIYSPVMLLLYAVYFIGYGYSWINFKK